MSSSFMTLAPHWGLTDARYTKRPLGLSSRLLGFFLCLLGRLSGDRAVLGEEAPVDADQGALVLGGKARVVADGAFHAGRAAFFLLVDESGAGEQRLGLDLQRVGDRFHHFGRRLVDASLDLAQVGFGDLRLLRQISLGL